MKKGIVLALVLVLVLSLSAMAEIKMVQTALDGDFDFEGGSDGRIFGVAYRWLNLDGSGHGHTQIDTDIKRSGNGSQMIIAQGYDGGRFVWRPDPGNTVVSGKEYIVQVWIKTEALLAVDPDEVPSWQRLGAYMQVGIMGSGGMGNFIDAVVPAEGETGIVGTKDWTLVRYRYLFEEEIHYFVRIDLLVLAEAGVAWFDDFSVYEVTPGSFNVVTGRVENTSGMGISGVTITAGDYKTVTDYNGYFIIENMEDGKYDFNAYQDMWHKLDLTISGVKVENNKPVDLLFVAEPVGK